MNLETSWGPTGHGGMSISKVFDGTVIFFLDPNSNPTKGFS